MSIISRPSLVGGSPSTPLSGLFLVDVGRAFIELSLSELKLAQRKLDLYPSYIAQLESRIGRIVARVVLKEFYDSGSWDLERSSSGYRTMISSLWSDQWRDYLFSKYEVLGYIPSIVHNELISLDRILSRLELDALDIEASFGIGYSTVVDIQCMGDYHATGTVSLLKFASGKSLYYKPHLSSNAEFIDLLLGHVGFGDLFKLSTPKRLHRGRYYWEEAISASAEDDNADYLFSMGGLLALSNKIGLQDLHAENILRTSTGIALLDLECIAMPHPRFACTGSFSGIPVESIGLLPQPFSFEGFSDSVDWSPFGGVDNKAVPAWGIHEFIDDGLPTVRLVSRRDEFVEADNSSRPSIGTEHINVFCEGYRRGFQLLKALDSKFIVDGLVDCGVQSRAVLRPTQFYANCMRRATYPRYMEKIDAQRSFYESWLKTQSSHIPAGVREAEIEDLLEHQVPIFTVSCETKKLLDLDLYSSVDVVVAQSERAENPGQLGRDLRSIRQCLTSSQPDCSAMPLVSFNQNLSRHNSDYDYAQVLGDIVEEICCAATNDVEIPIWGNLLKTDFGYYSVQSDPYSLYHGGSGIYVALNAAKNAGIKFSKAQAETLSRLYLGLDKCLFSSAENSSLGFFTGLSGVAYALMSGAKHSYRMKVSDRLADLILCHTDFEHHDVISGASGILGFVSQLSKQGIQSDKLLRAQRILVDYLHDSCRNDAEGNCTWEDTDDWVGGFAHGPLGVAWSLACSDFREQSRALIERAWQSHLSLLNVETGSWRRTSKGEDLGMFAWCHGGEGMLKALKPLSVMGIDGVTQVIAREVEFAQVAGVPLEGSLCHGLSGRMLNLANQTGKYDDRLRDSFLDYVKIMRDSDLCLSDSLMLGRSGVLYTAVKLYTGETHGSPLYCELGD